MKTTNSTLYGHDAHDLEEDQEDLCVVVKMIVLVEQSTILFWYPVFVVTELILPLVLGCDQSRSHLETSLCSEKYGGFLNLNRWYLTVTFHPEDFRPVYTFRKRIVGASIHPSTVMHGIQKYTGFI